MSTEFLVFAKSLFFVAKVKQYADDKKLEALAELERGNFLNNIDTKMVWKGLVVIVDGKLKFIGIMSDSDQIHRDANGRFGMMALRNYGSSSPPKTLKVVHTAWASSAGMKAWVKSVVRTRLFMKLSDRQLDQGLHAEQAQNASQQNAPVGAWSEAIANGSGAVQRRHLIGGRGEDEEFVPWEDTNAVNF